ncbi:MAG: gliding motility-associated C-terminal domain-containing protein, partial [Bacteroidales bacterium]|nr:gliding motility-associated C-terminal domain-containing protein [Bacteroidales bacterium]
GNSATCNTSFTVTDNTNPTIVTCAPAQSAFANASCQAAVPDFTANVTATDNCTASNALVITQSPTAGTLVSTGVTSVTITVADGAGNSATCNTSFTVTDNTNPVIVTCAPAQSAFANASCQASVPDFTANVTANDNCTSSANLTITQSPTAGTLVSTGVNAVTITVTDAAGNSATCNTSFTVTDNTNPTIVTCAPAQSAFANASCQASVPDFTANVTATDNCTASNALVITQSPTAGTLVSTGVTTVTITVTDAAGNSATCNTSFTVTDNTDPVIVTCAPAQSAFANASCQASVPDFTANVTATDNCTSAANLTITQSPAAGTLVSTGVTSVTITVTDGAGNSATCNTSFTVTDNTDPVIVTCAPAQSAFANASCQAAVPNFTANVTATDNCTASNALVITQSPTVGTLVSTGVTSVTITVTDAAGNSATCNTSFTVTDNTNPVIVTCAPAQSAFANASCQAAVPNFTANVTATDNCTVSNALVITQSPTAGTLVSIGVTAVTITVTDAAGNSATCNTSFTVTDNTNPVIVTCAPAQSAFANASCQAAVPNFTANVTATDNCTASNALVITQSPTAGTLVSTGVTAVTITVTDAAGNSATCNTSFTVTDNTNPVIVTCAPAQSAFANASCQASVPDFTANVTATDNCTASNALVITQSPTAGTLVSTGVTSVTITVADGAGNSATCNTSFTVTDNTDPVIVTCAPAQSAFANASCQASVPDFTANVTATDNCTSAANLTITQSPAAGTLVSTGVTSVTITVTDGAGNSATCNTSFTVTDNTNPVIVTCAPAQSAFANASCQAAVPNFTANVTATDNCTVSNALVITQSPTAGTLVSTGVTSVTITVTDAAGNSATCNTSFTVTDNTNPTIVTCAPAQSAFANASCQAAVPDFTANVTATDNCTSAANLTITQSPAAGTPVTTGVTTVTITVTDGAGNSATCNTSFTVTDNTNPVIVTCAPVQSAFANASCQAAVPNFTANVTATDNCTASNALVITQSPTVGTLVSTGVTSVTITVTDAAGNSATCNTSFTVTDNTNPVIVTCAPAQSAFANASCQASVPDFTGNVTATDNCTSVANLTITQSPAAGTPVTTGVTTVTITVTDAAGNSATCNTSFTVTDNTNPTIVTCAPAQSAFANATCQASVPDFTANVTATDNCTVSNALVITQSPTAGTLVSTGVTAVTITVTDAAGNSATCNTSFTVTDNTNPTIVTCAPAQSAFANASCQAAVPDFTANVTATDNCTSVANLTITQSPAEGTLVSTGVTTVTITVTDAAGNSATCNTSFTVIDNSIPTISGPGNVTVNSDPGLCTASNVNLGTPVTNDNCGIATITNNAGSTFPVGNTTVIWTVTDLSGQTATSSQTITVIDNQPPSITCPPSVTVNTDPGQSYASNVLLGNAITGDNCGVDTVYNNAPTQFPLGTTVVSWTVIDINGLSTTCTQTVTVTDNQFPTINCPPTIQVNCIGEVPAVYPDYAAFVLAGGSASDNDGINTGSFTLVSETSDGQSCPETISRVYKIADLNNNFSSCTQLVIVDDQVVPVITVPANVTVECSAVPAVGTATATDNCDTEVTVTYEGETRTNGACADSYTLTRTWKATDNCGNFATGSQVITVQDNTIPVITVPENVTVECSAVPAVGTATATDNCDSDVIVTYEGETRTNGTCADSYTLTRTWKATDNCGNFATGSQVITVQDNTIPVITVPANVTVECSAVPAVGTATATDNCDTEVTVTYEGETRTNGTCADSYTLTRTWKATDNCGNFATGSQVITVQDNTIPVITVPENVTVECSAVPAVGTATATDNCDTEVTVTYEGETRTNGTCADSYTLTRTWKATDNCGNFATGSQVITVQDNTIPVITVPENVTVECSAVPAVGTATATDNCDTDVTVTYEGESRTNGTCADSYTLTRTWKATDNCGNFATGSQVITVQDNTIPVITVPANVTVECSAVPAVGTATATDNCDSDVTVTYEGETRTNGTCADSYTLTRTWKATDNCGNFATGSQVITVQDNTVPVITVPANVTVECSAVPAVGTATATDNCDTDVTVTYEGETRTNGTCADSYTLTRTWKATDNCGNFATGSQVITVQDNTIPVITVPANVTVECSAVPAIGTATATDNCDSDVTVTYEGETRTNGTCADSYTLTRTWKATDNCGNFATGSQVITVQDNTIPVITVPANVTVECSVVPAVGTATATDNCDTDVTVTYEGESRTNGTCADSYTLTRTWKATDNCGNFATGSQVITVQDNTIPVITVPENVTVECSAVPAVGTATATDNCDNDVTVTYEGEARTNGSCADSYTLTRTWKATDNCGNFATGSQVITVQDNTIPVITVPENVTVECSAVPAVGTATATDNCDSDVTVTYEGETRMNGTCADSYTLTRTWKATDNCGNFATGSQVITVQDNTIPVITVPENVTVECSAVPAVGTATATDNCDSDVTVTYEGESRTNGTCTDSYTLTRTWKATDNCGNFATGSQVITVQDNTIPVITVPENVTVECSAVPAVGTATATDNCDNEVTVTYEGETRTNGTCTDSYTLTRTWKATDNCGNFATGSQVITVQDNTIPVITVPANVTVECSAVPAVGNATATDNCDSDVTVTYEGESRTNGTCADSYTLTRTWKATDNCGNFATGSQVITVQDNTIPEITVPANVTVECSAVPTVGNTTATDNCDTEVTVTYEGESRTNGTCADSYTLTRTWKATDNCGNFATGSQVITVQDNTIPEITVPANVTVECSAVPAVGTATATDNCDNDVTLTYEGESRTNGSCADSYTLTRTWKATDNCGNFATGSQVITVQDNTIPVITVPANVTVECSAVPAVGTATATDNCDSDVTVTYEGETRTNGTCADSYTLTRTWKATDNCGNFATGSQVITVQDNTIPVITVPANVTVECSAVPAVGTATATDNCDTDVTVTYEGETRTNGTCTDSYTLTRTWKATDNCGNFATGSQVITVQDNTIPVITVPANVTVECSTVPAVGTATATDNCDSDVTVTYEGETRTNGTCADSYTLTRTWKATDNCGNFATGSQVITVQDNTIPVITVPANVTVECSAVPAVGTATATDNCDTEVTVTYEGESRTNGTCADSYTLTRTWKATDNCGNFATGSQVITVQDNTIPVITVPENVTVECSAVPAVGTATATDNCDTEVTVTYEGESRTNGTCADAYTLTRTWKAIDNCGNFATGSQVITVQDNTIPVITVPANVTVECSAVPAVGTATATDNCDSDVTVTYEGESRTNGTCADSYTLTRTWKATDNCGNFATGSQVITVQDITIPEITVPENVTVECSAVPAVGTATATDNCDTDVTVTYEGESRTNGTCADSYTLTRTWKATDNCGNFATGSQVITVQDNTIPVITVPANVTVECSAVPAVGNATATDNCDSDVTVTYEGESRTNGTCADAYTLTRTWKATDNCGNFATGSQVITVQDNTIPVITVPENVTVECSAVPAVGTATATDNCDTDVTVTYEGESRTNGTCADSYTLTRTWKATDNCGNFATGSQVITVQDNTIPVITVPENVTVECSTVPAVGTATATDNCDSDVTVTYEGESRTNGSCTDSYTLTRTWKATDNCGNFATGSQVITVQDNTIPVITVPENVTVECSAVPAVGTATATDNCDTEVTVTYEGESRTNGTCADSYTLTRTWKATDNCGNFATGSQVITVQDNTVPVITVPANVTVECSAVPAVGTATATDNCDSDVTVTYEGESRTNGTCADSYTLTRTWKATDNCGNFATGSQVITVQDNTIPVITVPENVTVECSAVPAVGTATATDNCDTEVTVTYEGESRTNGTCADSYTLTRTWKATDNCGNFATGSQVITVQDNTIPVITVPANVTVECSAVPAIGTATATDNCDTEVTVTYEGESRTNGTCADSYTLTRTWKAIDNCGNFATGSQVITVQDNTVPVITVPANVTLECSAVPAVGTATATDNCDNDVTVTYEGESRTNGTCADSYTLTRTWKATDNCGNFATGSQVITVQDNTIPVITVPENVTVECSAVPAVGIATATDNCDSDVTVTYEGESRTNGTCADSYTLTRTWKATDNCGNFATGSQVITVQDNTIPVITVPANVTVECSAVPAVGTATATDNCDSDVTVTYEGESRTNGTCADSYTLTRTWKATDNCGNFATGSQVITVQDNTIPVITVPENVTVECSAVPAVGNATATDNCDSDVTVTYEGETRTNGTCADSYTLTRTWKAIDNCGNFATGSQVITVQDNTIPVITVPANVTVECSAVPAVGTATATDNCDSDVTVTYEGETRTNGTCADSYTLTRTWKATDNCGNFATGSQVITVQDNTIPVITVPENVTVECSAVPAVGTATATDNCDNDVTVTYEGETRMNGTCADSYTLTRTWKATDNCGNFATGSQVITVQDNTIPVITVPENVTVECSAVPAVGTATATDNCDNDVTVTYEGETRTNGTCADSYTLTRTWKATDNCGNFATGSQVITVQDNTIPVITVPANVTVECSAVPAVGTATATDNCDSDVTVTYDGEFRTNGTCADSYTLTRTWKAIDNCGNFTTGSQLITVQDNTAPVIGILPDPTTINCPALPEFTTPVATDACGGSVNLTSNDVTTAGSCEGSYSVTRTWTATDACNNSSTATQTINVQDVTAPVVICPASITVASDPGICGANVTVPAPQVTEGCSEVTLVNSFNNTGNASGLYPTGTTQVNWTITDACGNTSTCSMSVTITDSQAPVIVCPPDVIACTNETVVLGTATATDNCGVANVYYNGPSSFGTGTTIVTWIATDLNGNSSSCQQNVTVVAEVTVNAGPDASICETAESYTLTGASAENYASVIWTANGQGTLSNANTLNPTYTPAPGETGIILFTLTGIGQAPCGNATDQMALTIVPKPAGSAGNDNTICEGAYYQTLSASASNYSSLLWTSSGSGMFNNPGLLNTVYTPSQADIDAGSVQLSLTITGNMPCNPITDFMILHIEKSAQAYAGPDASVCNGSSYTVSAATVTNANTINWTHTGNGILENPGTLKPTYIPANGETGVITLRLEVTGTGNCGNATDEMLLNLAVSPTVNAGSDLSSCGVEVVAINGATASNYSSILWTTNGTGTFSNSNLLNPEYTPSQADVASGSVVLQLKAIGIAPCGDLSDQLTLTFGGYPMVEAGSDGNICEGESFTLTGVNATNYSILNWMISPETAGTISGSSLLNPTFNASPGFNGIVTLTLYAQGISGCADSTVSDFVKLIVNARPIVDAGSDQQIAEGASTQLSGSANSGSGLYAIKWEPAGLLVDSEILNPITKPIQSTSTFTLTVMDLATSCSSSDLMTVEIQGGVNNLIAIADYDTTRVKVPVTINVITNDINPENKQLSVTLCENPEHGIALINDDLTITYTPNFKFYGDDVFCYRICEVGNPSNCSDTLVYIHVVPSGMNDFDFFSGITPNEDEVNDDWIIRGIEDFPENTVIIFNRWGDKIREFEGYDNENNVWDGKNEHGKPVPDGTYFYILEINGLGKVSGWIYVRGNHQE